MNTEKKLLDPRTYLFLCIASIIAVIVIRTETSLAFLFAACMVIQAMCGKAVRIPVYLGGYLFLLWLSWAGVQLLGDLSTFFIGSALSNIGILGRRAMIPLSFAFLIGEAPTGSLLAAFHVLHIPKSGGIAVAVILRFFPTLGEEYRCIRNAQKFRGIGVGLWNTLAHLPSTLEYILVPLIMRTTKISDELSASITVRGVRFGGQVVSYRPLCFSRKDIALCAGYTAAVFLFAFLDKAGLGGI